VAQWKAQPGPMLFYPAMKQLTLDLAATSFLGTDIGPEVNEINRAFVDLVAASIAPIRRPLPGTQMARGVAGRKRIVAYFRARIPERRAKGGGDQSNTGTREGRPVSVIASVRLTCHGMGQFEQHAP